MKRLRLVAAFAAACATPALAQHDNGASTPPPTPIGSAHAQQHAGVDPHPADTPPPPAQHRFDRNHPETWRGRAEWDAFKGPRAGFWYAPGYGYRALDPRLAGHVWRRGERLPAAYRSFFVQTPSFYGLRPPPSGYRWVYVEGDFLLASTADGLIDEVVLNGY